jgi:SAUR family protein
VHLLSKYIMESKKSNKITEIVRLQQMLKKWKKLSVSKNGTSSTNNPSSSKGIKFIKRTLSFNDTSALSCDVPKGHLAVCVGEEMQRFVIPTEYLGHSAFVSLLREAEEEFGFQQEGVLRIPCEVGVFERILKLVQNNKDGYYYCSTEADFGYPQYSPNAMCR